MATSSREARRRKIMERGSDRLALITGRIQTLPSSSSSSPPDPQTHPENTPDQNPSSPPPPPLISDVQEKIAELPSEIEEHESDSTNSEALRALDSQVQQLISSLTIQNTVAAAPQPPRREPRPIPSLSPRRNKPIFTANNVSTAIAETERARLLFSVAVAILVVVAHLGFPLLGISSIVKTLLGFRPLYLVLLTNVTFVLAKLLGKPRVPDTFAEFEIPREGFEWLVHSPKVLEMGLVAYKVLSALFMDCAVYAVIVVCGLYFAQQ